MDFIFPNSMKNISTIIESIIPIIESTNPKTAFISNSKLLPAESINNTIPAIPSGNPMHMQHSTQLNIPQIKQAIEYPSPFIHLPYIKSFKHMEPCGLIFIL